MKLRFLIAFVVLAAGAVSAQDREFKPDKQIVFKQFEKDPLELNVFLPAGWSANDKRPAIVFFFGGGWTGGTPAQFYAHSRYFSSRGMVAISAQYRTKTSHGTSPFECIVDGKSAVRWVRQHAAELGVDPIKLAAGGGSAGGHVAATTGILKGLDETGENMSISSIPNALVLFNPVVDTTKKGYGAEKLGNRVTDASPVHHVRAGLPPTIIFHGTTDTTVPFENVERFCAEMKKAGNRCELVPFDGRAHGFFNYLRSRVSYATSVWHADRFLASLGFLRGEPTVGRPGDPTW